MINTYDYTLKELIVDKEYLFEVPNYQRSYVWTEKHIHQFLRDGSFCLGKYKDSTDKFEHYAGQMIFRKLKNRFDGRERLEIIDGQQRITTFMILVTAAIDLIRSWEGSPVEIRALQEKYLLSCFHSQCVDEERKLKLSEKDALFWKKLTGGNYADKRDLKLELESQRNIWSAYQMVRDYLEQEVVKYPDKKNAHVAEVYIAALADSFRVVVLMTEDPGYQFALYQIVNDRGLPLTPGEMLKARTIELFSNQSMQERRERQIRQAEEIWEDILSDSGKTTEEYLRWSYISQLGKQPDSRNALSLNEQYERDIFQCLNQREISMDGQDRMLEQLEQLKEDVHMCRFLQTGTFPIKGASDHLNLMLGILIRNMKNTFCIPLYLGLLRMNTEKRALAMAEELTPMLAKTYFMTKIMGNKNQESIMKCYLGLWRKINDGQFNADDARVHLEESLHKDKCRTEFYAKLNQPVYLRDAANMKTKFLLLMAELQYLKEIEKNFRTCGDDSVSFDFDKMSVEHILYEGVSENAVSRNFYESIHKIGNLTLMGAGKNTREGSRPFVEKRKVYSISPYYITREVGKLEEWNYPDYEKRQGEMVEVLKRAFEL